MHIFKNKVLRLVLAASLFTLISCGDDDDSTNVIINPDRPQEEEDNSTNGENGSVNVGTTVVVNNRINNNLRVTSNSRVRNNNLVFIWRVRNADPVTHQQWIHRGETCPDIIQNDFNRDGYVDEDEVQQVVGPRLLSLQVQNQAPSGSNYTYTRPIPLTELWGFIPPGEFFVVIYYGVSVNTVLPPTFLVISEGPIYQNVSIACRRFRSPTGGTTGGTTGETI